MLWSGELVWGLQPPFLPSTNRCLLLKLVSTLTLLPTENGSLKTITKNLGIHNLFLSLLKYILTLPGLLQLALPWDLLPAVLDGTIGLLFLFLLVKLMGNDRIDWRSFENVLRVKCILIVVLLYILIKIAKINLLLCILRILRILGILRTLHVHLVCQPITSIVVLRVLLGELRV